MRRARAPACSRSAPARAESAPPAPGEARCDEREAEQRRGTATAIDLATAAALAAGTGAAIAIGAVHVVADRRGISKLECTEIDASAADVTRLGTDRRRRLPRRRAVLHRAGAIRVLRLCEPDIDRGRARREVIVVAAREPGVRAADGGGAPCRQAADP